MRTNVKKENADPFKIQGFEGLCRVMRCREWVPDDEVNRLKTPYFQAFQAHGTVI